MISNCGHDENGRYTGGKAGDQTGTEWAVINWYNRPWKCVLRHPDKKVRKMIADMAREAAKNDLIGYDQNQRYTFWEHLKASSYEPGKITIACEADCSSGVAAIVKAAGYRLGITALQQVSIYLYTGNMREGLKAAGFTVLTDSKYLTSDDYLLEGDILLNDSCHVATNLSTGKKASTGATSGTTSGGGFQSTVKDFQKWLNKKGCGKVIAEDNTFGTETRAAALRVWKSEMNAIKVGYKFDVGNTNFGATCKEYGNHAIVKKGSKGTFTYVAQGMLRAKGHYTGELDGDAGSLTDAAIRAYQRAKGLDPDGECGANTWYRIFN